MVEIAAAVGLVALAASVAAWVRARTGARVEAALRDLAARLAAEEELAASLDPEEIGERVLAAAAALPGADAALLVVDGRRLALGLSPPEAERIAHETPTGANLRAMEVVYRYRLEAAGPGARVPRAAIVVPLRAGQRTLGSLSAVTRASPRAFPPGTAAALEALARRAGPALANAERFAAASRLAELDSLTGLYNQRVFHELLGREVARARRYGRRLSLIVLDLDDFKRINDRIGHLAGDRVLVDVASRLRACVRATDVACRVGGDEFAVILPESGQGDARRLAARIEAAVAGEPIAKAGTLRISAGVAELSSEDAPEDLFERADADLYRVKAQAKRAGPERIAELRPDS